MDSANRTFGFREIKKSYLELHVAGSGCFGSGGWDLFGEVGRRHDLLSQSDSVVLQEDQLQLVADVGVVVDDIADPVEQLDDLLGHVVAGGGFASWK